MNPETVQVLLLATGGLFAAVAVGATIYARRIALRLGKAAGVQVSDEQLKELERVVNLAVSFVEERVHRYLKGLVKEAPVTAEQKQAAAVQVARSIAPEALKAFSDEALKIVVDAKVQDRRVSLASASLVPPPPSFPPPAPALPTPAPPRRSS